MIFFVGVFWVVMSLVGQATATPEPPAHVDTPEEAAARVAKVTAMIARAEETRLESRLTTTEVSRGVRGTLAADRSPAHEVRPA